ncbi:MAG TPA: glycosyltransferase, partial [Casimicrobiaceae bacterium]|nr:glycosyltransferase [Casimicrobiaceae bacterium]
VALVHDWLDAPGGGESVLSSLLQIYAGAPVFTLVDFLTVEERQRLGAAAIHPSPVQRIPGARHWFRYAAALFPRLIERLDTSRYDVIISDSHAIAKGVRKRSGQVHVCYCYTPARFAWTMAPIYRERAASGSRWRERLADRAQRRFRDWDVAASRRVDHFIAISRHIAEAIERCYGRTAPVIYPPVDVDRFRDAGRGERGTHYVTLSRLVPYKRIDVIVEAFRRLPQRRLVIVGDGPERSRLARALPPNVTLAGRLDDGQSARSLGEARAFVFAAEEDFGIAAIEAQAAGTPVIAYRGGASAETIRDLDAPLPTGVLFDAQTPEAIVDAIARFEAVAIDADACRINAARFAAPRFRAEFAAHVDRLLREPASERAA